MTMTVGEKAEIVIQPEWAYGKKGLEGKYSFCQLCCFYTVCLPKVSKPLFRRQ